MYTAEERAGGSVVCRRRHRPFLSLQEIVILCNQYQAGSSLALQTDWGLVVNGRLYWIVLSFR
jgi:hypothetical protein